MPKINLKPLTNATKCKPNEIVFIQCPKCKGIGGVAHLAWSELTCDHCKEGIKKTDWFYSRDVAFPFKEDEKKTLHLFLGFEFTGGNRKCTFGEPNIDTGRFSIAGNTFITPSIEEFNIWLDKSYSSKTNHNERIRVTKPQLRKLCLGQSLNEFEEMISSK